MEAAHDRDNGLVVDLIRAAACAGKLRVKALEEPAAARGLTKCADFHSARCNVLMDQIFADHSAGLEPYRVVSHAREGGRHCPARKG